MTACEVHVEIFGVVLSCKNTATQVFEVGCVHEHVHQVATCGDCAPGHDNGADFCRECATGDDPHDCVIRFSERAS